MPQRKNDILQGTQLGVEQEIWARLTEGVGRVLRHA